MTSVAAELARTTGDPAPPHRADRRGRALERADLTGEPRQEDAVLGAGHRGAEKRALAGSDEVAKELRAPLSHLKPHAGGPNAPAEPRKSGAPGAGVRVVRVDQTAVQVEEEGPERGPRGAARRRLEARKVRAGVRPPYRPAARAPGSGR